MPDKRDAQKPPSPEAEDRAYLAAYDNPEVFQDPSLPQLYKLRIVNTLVVGTPDILRIEVNGEMLSEALSASMLSMMRHDEKTVKTLQEEYGTEDWEEICYELYAEDFFEEVELEMRRFFVRHLPQLMVRLYDIASVISATAALGSVYQPTERAEKDRIYRLLLKKVLRFMENDIKQMLETRPKGRPKKIESNQPPDKAPEIARQVWKVACGIMGDARGIDAVPGLKEIAYELGTSENALGKQLTRAKWSWTRIKNDLANLP